MTPEKQGELLEQYKAGNDNAINELYTGLDKDLRGYIRRKSTFSPMEIDDIVQDTWVLFMKNCHKCRNSVLGFLTRGCAFFTILTAKQEAYAHQTITWANQNQDDAMDYIIENWDDVEASIDWISTSLEDEYRLSEEQGEKLDNFFEGFGDLEKEVYLLHIGCGYTYKEIGEDLDLTVKEIRVIMDNIVKKIRRRLKK